MQVVTCGSSGAGKTTLLHQLTARCPGHSEATIGVAFTRFQGLEIWDTAGQEKYRAILPLYFRRASAVVVVFDLSSRPSFAAVPAWVRVARASAPATALVVLVGTKCDLQPSVTYQDAQDLAQQLELAGYWETSGMSGQGVEAPFTFLQQHAPASQPDPDALRVGVYEKETWSCC